MRNLKKFLALVLAMMMTLSLMVTVNAATPTDFSDGDKITDAYKEAVDVLSALKVVKGDDRGFRPGETITRAEVSAILYRIVTGDVDDKNAELYKGANYFTDVTADRWYDGYVNYCANNGLVLGVGGGKFNPNAPVTGYEALVMILRAIGFNNPKEFSSDDWRLKASGYGRRYGITDNIAEARLAGPATREIVAEIMFQGLEVPTVKYTVLSDYQPTGTYQAFGYTYAQDLLWATFRIVQKDLVPLRDEYGRPSIHWRYTNGKTAIEIPVDPVDTFYTAMDECTVVEKLNEGEDIDVTNEFLNGRAVERTNTNSKGEIIGTRTLDALHTTNDFVGAQGRKTMVYNYTIKAYGYSNTYWDIVYIDTYLGEVKAKTPATLDTNGHTMHKATLSIEVGAYDGSNAAHPYAMLTSDKNFDDYNVGDVLLLNTWSPSFKNTVVKTDLKAEDNSGDEQVIRLDWTGLDDALTVARLTTKASAQPAMADIAGAAGVANVKVQMKDANGDYQPAPAAAGTTFEFSYAGTAYPAGNYKVTMTAEGVGTITYDPSAATYTTDIPHATHDFDTDKFEIVSKATEKTVTISGTTGAANDKTGIYVGNETIMANVVYHMHQHTSTADAVAANNSTPTTAADFYNKIVNEQIGKTYRLWLDGQGNILGMKPAVAAGVGVVLSVEGVRVASGQYALEATLLMEDESTLTAMFLDDGTAGSLHQFFNSATDAEDNYADGSDVLGGTLKFAKNALVEIEPYTKYGKTFYQVKDGDAAYTKAKPGTTVTDGTNNTVHTGVSNTLTGDATHRVNGDTVFFVAYKDFQYNWGTGNTGGNDDIIWKVIRDFRDIPTINGATTDKIVMQTLDETDNVAKYAAITSEDFTGANVYDMTGKTPVAVDDSYLIIKPIGTYARYSEYAVMHNGVKETLKVANLNGGVNTNVETALASGQLVTVSGWNMENAAINVAFVGNSNVVKAATTVSYDNAGVLTLVTGAIQSKAADGTNDTALAADAYMTMAKDVKVMIVNRDRNEVYEGTTGSIAQYASYTGGHAFAWELDANGYISTLYILD